MRKRILTILATLAMVLTMIPSMAFADASAVEVATYDELVNALSEGKDVKLIEDIDMTEDTWIKIGTPTDQTTSASFDLTGVTIDGNGRTIRVGNVESNGNGAGLFSSKGNCQFINLTIDLTASTASRAIEAGDGDVISDVVVYGKEGVTAYGVIVSSSATNTVTIEDSAFQNMMHGIYIDDNKVATVEIISNLFDNCEYAVILNDGKFMGNTVIDSKLNVKGTATVEKNYFETTGDVEKEENGRIKFYNSDSTFSNNWVAGEAYIDFNSAETAGSIDLGNNYYENPDIALGSSDNISEEKKNDTIAESLCSVDFVVVIDGKVIEDSREYALVKKYLTEDELNVMIAEAKENPIEGYEDYDFKGYFMDPEGEVQLEKTTEIMEGDTIYMIWGLYSGSVVTPDKDKTPVDEAGNNKETPQTGDDFNMTVPFALAGLAVAGMAAALVTRRKQSQKSK